jgi:hypothetical protein
MIGSYRTLNLDPSCDRLETWMADSDLVFRLDEEVAFVSIFVFMHREGLIDFC